MRFQRRAVLFYHGTYIRVYCSTVLLLVRFVMSLLFSGSVQMMVFKVLFLTCVPYLKKNEYSARLQEIEQICG